MPSFRPAAPVCAALLLLICSACTSASPMQAGSSSADVSLSLPESDVSSSAPDVSAPEEAFTPDESSVPAVFIPEPSAPPTKQTESAPPPASEPVAPPAEDPIPAAPSVPPTPVVSAYDFSQPVPERDAVGTDYFSDAAFVGDSRSEGFYLYGVKRGKNLSASGLSVFTFAEKKMLKIGGTYYTALSALSLKEYGKVYLGFGVNELGYINTDSFYEHYCSTIDAVRACQPNAVIYAQTMAPVNETLVAATGGKKHLNNDRVRLYNDLIRKAAQEKQVPLLDVYTALAVNDSLPADASRDGIHLNRDYCQKQLEYIRRHTTDLDTLYTPLEPEVPTHETSSLPAADSSADAGSDSLLPQSEAPDLSTEPVPPPITVDL